MGCHGRHKGCWKLARLDHGGEDDQEAVEDQQQGVELYQILKIEIKKYGT